MQGIYHTISLDNLLCLQAKALNLSNFLVERDFAIAISRISKLERDHWKYDMSNPRSRAAWIVPSLGPLIQ